MVGALIPKKVKYRKAQKGRSKKRMIDTRGTELSFGSYGIKALEAHWIKNNQLDAARKAILQYIKKGGKFWVRIFPYKPITKKPPEVTMGAGKGDVDHYVAVVRPGRIILEIDGLKESDAYDALRLAASKLPIKTKIVKKM